ncbi:hypothetical protein PanWU01x14_276690, partial [Parasponia andersonii]
RLRGGTDQVWASGGVVRPSEMVRCIAGLGTGMSAWCSARLGEVVSAKGLGLRCAQVKV